MSGRWIETVEHSDGPLGLLEIAARFGTAIFCEQLAQQLAHKRQDLRNYAIYQSFSRTNARLKIQFREECRFEPDHPHHFQNLCLSVAVSVCGTTASWVKVKAARRSD